jgi:ABC-2 type transport system permease protein
MFKSLIEFEIKTWLKAPATILVFAFWAILVFFSISTGSEEIVNRQIRFDSLQHAQGEKFQKHKVLMDSFDKGFKEAPVYWDDARNAYYMGNYYGTRHLTKPIYNLAAIAIGQSRLHHADHLITTSQEYWFSALRKTERLDNPINSLYGQFDLGFLMVWLFPLLIIVLTYNMLSAEAEQGTLKMLLTEGLSAGRLLIVKSSFRGAMILGFSFLFILMGSLIFAVPIFKDQQALFLLFLSITVYGVLDAYRCPY